MEDIKQCIIVGGGPAGTAAALAAASAGLRSVLIVERDAFGGTCTNRGCIPTKFLLSRSGSVAGAGESPEGRAVGWQKVLQHKDALVRGLSRSQEETCLKKGVEIAGGSARFVSRHEIEVTAPDGTRATYGSEHFVIATGARPAELPGSPFDGSTVISSDQALSLDPLPRSLAIIGSGAVGAECAFLFTRLGVRVTLIEGDQRLFPAEDPEVDALFRRVFPRVDVDARSGDPVVGVARRHHGAGAVVTLASGASVEAEKVLVAVGRSLESTGLGLDAAAVAVGARGAILVDEHLRTSQAHIYAAGDVTGRMLLAHAATAMGECVGRALAGQEAQPVPYHSIPWATFTTPEVAGVGLTVDKARQAGLDAVAASALFMGNVKARIDRTTDGFVKIVADRTSGTILGGTIAGAHASDLIHVLSLAVHQRMTTWEMRGVVFAHPTTSETFADALDSLKTIINQRSR